MLNIHHLELFYHVARHGGIMEAVRNMPYGIQQPAVSGQILQLESDLGIKLFQRRPFELTPAGRELYEFIRPFFANVESVGEKIRGGTTQSIRMAAPAVVLREHLPGVLLRVHERFPRLKLTLREAHQPMVEQWLERQEIDLAVTVLEGNLSPGLHAEPLLELKAQFLVPKGSRFTSSNEIFEALARGNGDDGPTFPPLISLPPNEALPRRFRSLLGTRNLDWPASIEVNALDLIEIYAANGFGIGLSLDVPGKRPSPRLRALPIPELAPIQFGALWRGTPTPLLEALLDTLRSRAQAVVA